MIETATDEHKQKMLEIINDDSKKWSERLNDLIEYQKEHLGLKGFHASVYPDDENKEYDREKACHDVCLMEKACIEGKSKDITGECL